MYLPFYRKRGWLVVAVLGVAVAGVASAGLYYVKTRPDPANLESRVRTFWDAKVNGDLVKAYALEAASQTNSVDLGSYLRKRTPALKYLDYTIESIQESGDDARVKVGISYSVTYPKAAGLRGTSRSNEKWRKLNGAWFRETKAGPAPIVADH